MCLCMYVCVCLSVSMYVSLCNVREGRGDRYHDTSWEARGLPNWGELCIWCRPLSTSVLYSLRMCAVWCGAGVQYCWNTYVYILPSVNNKDNIRYYIVVRQI